MPHKPVLLFEVLEYLNLKPGQAVLDGTFGEGGHSNAILEKIGETGTLIAIDQDLEAIEKGKNRFKDAPNIHFSHANFEHMDDALKSLNISSVDAVLLDVGVSSNQLDSTTRGFSFKDEVSLDMRMDQTSGISASEWLATADETSIADVLYQYGEERKSRVIAKDIVNARKLSPIETAKDLADIVEKVYAPKFQSKSKPHFWKKHPATKTFQGIRIFINRELEVLETGITQAWNLLKQGGRLAVISFHSLEDRIVKNIFRNYKQQKEGKVLTKKPVISGSEELEDNARARSAKLRVIEKL